MLWPAMCLSSRVRTQLVTVASWLRLLDRFSAFVQKVKVRGNRNPRRNVVMCLVAFLATVGGNGLLVPLM